MRLRTLTAAGLAALLLPTQRRRRIPGPANGSRYRATA